MGLLTFGLAAAGWRAAGAQQPAPVFVEFQFKVPAVSRKLAGTEAAKQATMSALLASRLTGRWPYWSFQPASSVDDHPRLALWLEERGDEWKLNLALTPLKGQPETGRWWVVLYPVADIRSRGVPPVAQMMDDIDRRFAAHLAEPAANAVFDSLVAYAPVGKQVAHLEPLAGTAPRALAVLPLAWEKYCGLASSEFVIDGTLQSTRRIRLSRGEPGSRRRSRS